MEKITEITLAWELFQQGAPKAHIATHLGRNRETVILWLQGIQEQGLTVFLERYQQAKKQPRARLLRTEDCLLLKKEHQITLSVPKISVSKCVRVFWRWTTKRSCGSRCRVRQRSAAVLSPTSPQ